MDWIVEFMAYRKSLFGLLWPEFALYSIIIIIGISIAITTIKAFMAGSSEPVSPKAKRKKAEDSVAMVQRVCAGCGWEGNVPKHNKVCPKCGQSNFIE